MARGWYDHDGTYTPYPDDYRDPQAQQGISPDFLRRLAPISDHHFTDYRPHVTSIRREMVAADLGLRTHEWFYVGAPWYDNDAPYSFWLGANNG
jgi:hypothetical protein